MRADDYPRYYTKLPHKRYESRPAIQVSGEFLPFDQMAVLHGTFHVDDLKKRSKEVGVSITKYLAAALLWSIIQTETDGKEMKHPAALNLPVNLRSFFESEMLATFFAVINISWSERRAPESLSEVLEAVSRQVDELIVQARLEKTIFQNVGNAKKWYVSAIPTFGKSLAT